MKKIVTISLLVTTLAVGWAFSANSAAADGDHNAESIVGAWEVT